MSNGDDCKKDEPRKGTGMSSKSSETNPEQLSLQVDDFDECPTGRSKRSWMRDSTEVTPISPRTFTKRKSCVNKALLVKVLKRDSLLRRRFESFAEKQYAIENVAFIKCVLEWKSMGFTADYAHYILDTFIVESAPNQVNISYSVRTTIEGQFRNLDGYLPANIFDPAVREISAMMVDGGIWGTFVWGGGVDLEFDEADETWSMSREGSSAAEIILT